MSVISLTLFTFVAGLWRWKLKRCNWEETKDESPEVTRLSKLFRSSKLIHPFILTNSVGSKKTVANFRDLAIACAQCCGVFEDVRDSTVSHSNEMAELMGGTTRNHIILILCDGMGTSILEKHLPKTSFVRRFNKANVLRAVFPSTTPAALTTLATAEWPGQHGVPGWDLREPRGCEYPGESCPPHAQIRILADKITDFKTGETYTNSSSTSSMDDVFVSTPWAQKVRHLPKIKRKMVYINAYNGGDSYCTGHQSESSCRSGAASDFSLWQMGGINNPFESVRIDETVASTLGKPEGSKKAVECFSSAIDAAFAAVKEAESQNRKSFVYLYTAHPDKHMHALGTDDPEVRRVLEGFNSEIERLKKNLSGESTGNHPLDATIIVTADHGHVTVKPDEMIQLPQDIIECLEYSNIGVHGKGRHGYLHCKNGLQTELRKRWRKHKELDAAFLLLTIEEAASMGLFGPKAPNLKVRPRMGDFVAIATSHATLVSPGEFKKYHSQHQGAHGSLLPAEMNIPFIYFTTAT
mmetsp:Transcript_28906/g.42643  ORF Transcript_28906/g.42643 Transcript_28906/m.42643 type:complete len:524 (-) Transcript_28906:664-2235(-)